jgi:hypothetical protein
MPENTVYSVCNDITHKTIYVTFEGGSWFATNLFATFQFFSFESAKRGARIISGVM